jgi:hypothetical protein
VFGGSGSIAGVPTARVVAGIGQALQHTLLAAAPGFSCRALIYQRTAAAAAAGPATAAGGSTVATTNAAPTPATPITARTPHHPSPASSNNSSSDKQSSSSGSSTHGGGRSGEESDADSGGPKQKDPAFNAPLRTVAWPAVVPNLGYACLNDTLRAHGIFTSRDCVEVDWMDALHGMRVLQVRPVA